MMVLSERDKERAYHSQQVYVDKDKTKAKETAAYRRACAQYAKAEQAANEEEEKQPQQELPTPVQEAVMQGPEREPADDFGVTAAELADNANDF